MRLQSENADPEIERVQIELMRKMSPAEKFAMIGKLSQDFIEVAWMGIRREHPIASEDELKLIFVERFYGKELADDGLRTALQKRRKSDHNVM